MGGGDIPDEVIVSNREKFRHNALRRVPACHQRRTWSEQPVVAHVSNQSSWHEAHLLRAPATRRQKLRGDLLRQRRL